MEKDDSSDQYFEDDLFGEDFESEIFPNVKIKQRKDISLFLAVTVSMIFVIIISLLIIIFLISNDNKIKKQELVKPYYTGSPLIFPPKTQDWKLTYAYGSTIFYCEIDGKWYRCFPEGVDE